MNTQSTLLETIQSNLIDENYSLGAILLKFRLFASKLGSDLLEDWVRHESEGYPDNVELPKYRRINVAYEGSFSGPLGRSINNTPIPPAVVSKFAGSSHLLKEIRHSVSGMEDLMSSSDQSGLIYISSGNLSIALNGKYYPDYSCISVTGLVSTMAIVDALNAVRTKLLDLTIAIEKNFPKASEIKIGAKTSNITHYETEKVSEMAQHIIYGNQTIINNSGENNTFNLSVEVGNIEQFSKNLIENGISEYDVKELSEIVKNEQPENSAEPFGTKAKEWLSKNIGKAFSGAWKVSGTVATTVITEAVKNYYGLS